MFVNTMCARCWKELPPEAVDAAQIRARITTERGSEVTCSRGHVCYVVFQDGGYALLYERALQRLAEGSSRDAVLDAYTAFEMYLPHVAVRARYDRELGASPRTIRKELGRALSTSDRCLAAALGAFSVACGRAPPDVPEWLPKVRNDGVHKGRYPSAEKAERACLEVYSLVRAFEDGLSATTCVNSNPYSIAVHLEEVQDLYTSGSITPEDVVFGGCSCVLDPTLPKPPSAALDRLNDYRSGRRPRAW